MHRFKLMGVLTTTLLISALILLAPGSQGAWVNLFGLLIVLGGTVLAVLVSRPQALVLEVIRSMPDLLKRNPETDCSTDIQHILKLAHPYRHGQVRQVEQMLKNIQHTFLRKGVNALLDRTDRDDMQRGLQLEIVRMTARAQEQASVLRSMAGYAPAFGMLGTLLGLIHMLHGLGDQGLEHLGATMGFALMTTLFGLLAANLVFKPLAIKLERQLNQETCSLMMLMEGLMMVQANKHPILIKERLDAYRLDDGPLRKPARASSIGRWVSAYAD